MQQLKHFSLALYFDMLSSYLKGLWTETGEGIHKEVKSRIG